MTTYYFPNRWHRRRVMNWLLDRNLVQGCLNLRQSAMEQGLHVEWNYRGKLIWAFTPKEKKADPVPSIAYDLRLVKEPDGTLTWED